MKILLHTSTALAILGCCFSNSLLASHHEEASELMGHYAYAQTQQIQEGYDRVRTQVQDSHFLYMYPLQRDALHPSPIFMDCNYPQAVLVQPMSDRRGVRINGGQTQVPLVIHFLTDHYLKNLPFAIQDKLARLGTRTKDVKIMLSAQDYPWNDDTLIMLRPHYATARGLEVDRQFEKAQEVQAGIFDLRGCEISLDEPFVRTRIVTQGDGFDITPSKTDTLHLNGTSKLGHSFYSLVATPDETIITLHWLLNDEQRFALSQGLHDDFQPSDQYLKRDAEQALQFSMQAFTQQVIQRDPVFSEFRQTENEFYADNPLDHNLERDAYEEARRKRQASFDEKHADLIKRYEAKCNEQELQRNAADRLQTNGSKFMQLIEHMKKAESFQDSSHLTYLFQLMNIYQPRITHDQCPWPLAKLSAEDQQKLHQGRNRLIMPIPFDQLKEKGIKSIVFHDAKINLTPSILRVAKGTLTEYADLRVDFTDDAPSQTIQVNVPKWSHDTELAFWVDSDAPEDLQLTFGRVELVKSIKRALIATEHFHLGTDVPSPFQFSAGFSGAEGTHRWTDGRQNVNNAQQAVLHVLNDKRPIKTMRFIETVANGIQDVTVRLDGVVTGRYHYGQGMKQTFEVPFPYNAGSKPTITFDISNPSIIGDDNRLFGMLFRQVEVDFFDDRVEEQRVKPMQRVIPLDDYRDDEDDFGPDSPRYDQKLLDHVQFSFYPNIGIGSIPEDALKGFSDAEKDFRWTQAKEASISVPNFFGDQLQRTKTVTFEDVEALGEQLFTVSVNGQPLEEMFTFSENNPKQSIVVPLPENLELSSVITFNIPTAELPIAFDQSNKDQRLLGLSFKTVKLNF